MHCHICDADSDTVVLEHGEFSPCAECQAVIFDCLQGYPDQVDPDAVIYTDLGPLLDEDFDDHAP